MSDEITTDGGNDILTDNADKIILSDDDGVVVKEEDSEILVKGSTLEITGKISKKYTTTKTKITAKQIVTIVNNSGSDVIPLDGTVFALNELPYDEDDEIVLNSGKPTVIECVKIGGGS